MLTMSTLSSSQTAITTCGDDNGRMMINDNVYGTTSQVKTSPLSPFFSFGVLIGTLVVLVALIFKRHDAPTNFYLLFTFVSGF